MSALRTQFGFTKLLVDDLERVAAFYKSVCDLQETVRVESEIAGRRISEIMFAPTGEGAGTFVLLKFLDAPKPTNDEVILGFITTDVDAFIARAVAAGGSVAQAAYDNVEHGVKVGFVKDVEGHLIEVVELLAPAQG